MRRPFVSLLVLFALLVAGPAPSGADDAFEARLRAAMDGAVRSEADRARDANRLPVETLAFFGIREDMRVLELFPGRGWYTKLLGPTLAEKGKLYVAIGTSRIEEGLLGEPGFEAVEVLAGDLELERTELRGIYDLGSFSFGVEGLDAVLTFRNLHNLTPEARKRVHEAAYRALRPGGIYGAVDHTRRHMESANAENRRRMDPVEAVHELVSSGFVFEAYTDLHYRADDELRYEVGRRSVSGNTDRFTFLFRKPESR